MADTNNAGGSNGNDANAEGASAAASQENAANAGAGDNAGENKGKEGEGGDAGAGDSKKADDKKADDKSQKADDEEPQGRKSNAWWVAKRRGDTIAKIKGDKKDGDGQGDGAGEGKGADDKGGDDNDFQSKIDAALDERLAPLKQKELEAEVDNDIASFVAAEPKFKPYAAKVRKWALHESRRDLPVESIFYEVAGKDLMKLGAEKAQEAAEEAKKSQGTGGGSNAADGAGKSVWDMTPEEFAAEQLRIRTGGGNK